MATYNYARIRLVADRIIKKYGGPAIVRRPGAVMGGEDWNPTTGAPTDFPVTAVIVEYTEKERGAAPGVDADTAIRTNDRRALISAEGIVVDFDPSYQLVIGVDVYAMVKVSPLRLDGVTTVLYDVQVRS